MLWLGCWWDMIVVRKFSVVMFFLVCWVGRLVRLLMKGSLCLILYWIVGGRCLGWLNVLVVIVMLLGVL